MPLGHELTVANSILNVLVADARTNVAGVRSLAEAFANSYSFDRTRERERTLHIAHEDAMGMDV